MQLFDPVELCDDTCLAVAVVKLAGELGELGVREHDDPENANCRVPVIDAPCQIARIGVGWFDLGVEALAAGIKKPHGAFYRRQDDGGGCSFRRAFPDMDRGDEKESLLIVREFEACDLILGPAEASLTALGQKDRVLKYVSFGQPVSDDDLRFIMDINLTEALLCTRAVGAHMLARRSGKVINIAAWTAHQGGRDNVIYTTAKTALAGSTRAQALEWAPYGLHVNAIGPGLFPDVVTSGEEGVARSTSGPRPGAAWPPRQIAQGRIAGALPRLGRLRLHDRADHPARRRTRIVIGRDVATVPTNHSGGDARPRADRRNRSLLVSISSALPSALPPCSRRCPA